MVSCLWSHRKCSLIDYYCQTDNKEKAGRICYIESFLLNSQSKSIQNFQYFTFWSHQQNFGLWSAEREFLPRGKCWAFLAYNTANMPDSSLAWKMLVLLCRTSNNWLLWSLPWAIFLALVNGWILSEEGPLI